MSNLLLQNKIKPLITQRNLHDRVVNLGREIQAKWPETSITLLAVSSSSQLVVRDLAELLGATCSCLVLPVNSSGQPEVTASWVVEQQRYWEGVCILVQEVSDTGETLLQLRDQLSSLLDIPVQTLVLLQKKTKETYVFCPDYVGFSIPDEFVVGYGMGLRGQFSQLPHIAVLTT